VTEGCVHMSEHVSESDRFLQALTRRNAAAYLLGTRPDAILLTGSAATGHSDFYSDLDLILYYHDLPSADMARYVCDRLGGSQFAPLGQRTENGFADHYFLHGVECQVAHTPIRRWEEDMSKVLDQSDVTPHLQKAMQGLVEGVPLHGESLINKWKERATHYPDSLAQAVIEHHADFVPMWKIRDQMIARDARLWLSQVCVETAYNILGVLAGLNRVYYSTFQFKRMRELVEKMRFTPPNLADRIDNLFNGDLRGALDDLWLLVRETMSLVRTHAPDVPTDPRWLEPNDQKQPWTPGLL